MVKVKSDLSKDLTKNIVHKVKFCNILIVVIVWFKIMIANNLCWLFDVMLATH
jgi:hypothetical protein